MVVSTTQVDDCEESSSFLMERLLQALLLSGTDLMSAQRRGVLGGTPSLPPGQDSPRPSRSAPPPLLLAARELVLDQEQQTPKPTGAGRQWPQCGFQVMGQGVGRGPSACLPARLAGAQDQWGWIFYITRASGNPTFMGKFQTFEVEA